MLYDRSASFESPAASTATLRGTCSFLSPDAIDTCGSCGRRGVHSTATLRKPRACPTQCGPKLLRFVSKVITFCWRMMVSFRRVPLSTGTLVLGCPRAVLCVARRTNGAGSHCLKGGDKEHTAFTVARSTLCGVLALAFCTITVPAPAVSFTLAARLQRQCHAHQPAPIAAHGLHPPRLMAIRRLSSALWRRFWSLPSPRQAACIMVPAALPPPGLTCHGLRRRPTFRHLVHGIPPHRQALRRPHRLRSRRLQREQGRLCRRQSNWSHNPPTCSTPTNASEAKVVTLAIAKVINVAVW